MKYRKPSLFVGALLAVLLILGSLIASPSVRTAIANTFGQPPQEATVEPAAEVYTVGFSAEEAFHWLDPIAPSSGDTSDLDASLLHHLTVEVCEVTGNGCTTVKTFSSAGSSAEQLRIMKVGSTGGYFIVNWDTQKAKISLNATYRIVVRIPGLQLGSIDLAPVTYRTFGRTWPIKFLVEKDPVIRTVLLSSLGTSIWEVADELRTDLGICGDDLSQVLLANYPNATAEEVEMVVNGVCQEVIIPDTTKVTDAATRDALAAYDPATGQLLFSSETSLLKNLKVDDVIASKPSTAAPYGYLRKVTSVNKVKGAYIVESVQAKLFEAITKGTLQTAGTLLPSTGAGTNARPLAPGERNAFGASLDEGDQLTVDQPIDVTINFEEEDGDVSGTGTVRIQGHVFIRAGYNIGAGIEPCVGLPPVCVDRLEAWMGFEQKSNLRVTGNFKGTVKKEKTIYPVPMQPIIFFIGFLPVVLVPQMNVIVGIEGNAEVNFEFAAQSEVNMKPYLKWTEDEGWKDLSEIGDPLEKTFLDADMTGTIQVEAYAKLDASLLLYGVIGPSVDGSLGIGGKAQLGASPLWQVYGHAEIGIGLRSVFVELFGLEQPREALLDESFLIKEAENTPPEFTNVRGGLIPVEVGEPVYLGPRTSPTSLQGFYEVRDPDSGNAPNLAITLNGQPVSETTTFSTPGLRTIKVTATDNDGGVSSIFLAIDVRNSVPILTVTPAIGEVLAGEQFFLTARAYDPEDGFLPCRRISWSVTAPDTLQVSSNPNTCMAVVLFNQVGTRQVRVSATDGFGTSFEQLVNVDVGPAPANRKPVIDMDSFKIYAFRGPRNDQCPLGLICEVPNDKPALLSNGELGSGDYSAPLYMEMNVTDPEGDPFGVQWFCQTGDQFATVIYPGDEEGLPSCEPIYSPSGAIIRVYAAITTPGGLGGDGYIVLGYSPEYHFVMLQRTQ